MAFNRTKQKNVFLEVVSEIRNYKGFGELYYLLDIFMHDIDRVAIVDQSEVTLVIEEIFAVLAQLWLYFLKLLVLLCVYEFQEVFRPLLHGKYI
jgi:hypothetical protein